MNWEGLFKKYIWNNRTPYFIPVTKLTRIQANSEILIYCIFLGIFFLLASIMAIHGEPRTQFSGASLYSFSIVCSCIIFKFFKSYATALYLSTSPIIVLVYIHFYGVSEERNHLDTLIVTIILLCLIRYSIRVVA